MRLLLPIPVGHLPRNDPLDLCNLRELASADSRKISLVSAAFPPSQRWDAWSSVVVVAVLVKKREFVVYERPRENCRRWEGRELLVDRKETPRDDQDRDETARSSCVFLEIG